MFLYAKVGDIRSAAGAEANLADVYNRVGAHADAEAALERALEGCRRVGHRVMEGYAELNLGYARAKLERLDEARASLKRAEDIARATKNARLLVWVAIYKARADLSDRPPEEVAAAAERAIEDAKKSGLPAQEVVARTIAARALLKAAETTIASSPLDSSPPASPPSASNRSALLDRALAHAAAAVSIRDQIGGVEEDEAELFLVFADLLEKKGRADDARQSRLRGRKIVEEAANKIGDAELRRRFQEHVPAHVLLLHSTL
jgi:tetratricopeptide (TPR) repeat protein